MNFGAFQGPNITMAADDFVGMRQLQAQLRQEVERLSNRCCDLENQVNAQIQARRASDSQVFQLERARIAREADIVALRSQLDQEGLRADAIGEAGRPVLYPASLPVRLVSVGNSRTDLAAVREFSRNDSADPSKLSEPSPGPVPPLSLYPHDIPEQDRETIRTRMLKDRGPRTPVPAASQQEVEKAPPALSPDAPVSGPSHDGGITPNEAGASQLDREKGTEAADVDSEETEDDCADDDMEVDDDDDFDDCCAHATTTSASSVTLGCPDKQEPCNQDADNGLANLAPSPTAAENFAAGDGPAPVKTADDCCSRDITTFASTVSLICPDKQEPCDQDDGNREANPAPSPTAAGNGSTNNNLAPVKTESCAVPCTTFGSYALSASTTASEPASSSSAVHGHEAEGAGGTPSRSGGFITAPSVVKTEAIPSLASAAVSREAPKVTNGSASPAPTSFSHQLFSPSAVTEANSMRSVSDSTDTIDPPGSIDDDEARYLSRRGEKEGSSGVKQEPVCRDRFSHNTFCSSCKSFRTEQEALAKCAACPRIMCRTCAGHKGEKVPRGLNADDTVFPPGKCLCQKRDSEFPSPGGKDPQAHLLKQLKKHDLAYMFLEPVNVEENPGYLDYVARAGMIDLGTMTTKMKKHKQYQSLRGKLMFRRDLKKMWENCWTFAGHAPESSIEKAAGIVRCTLTLEAMVHKFYEVYMEDRELVTDQGTWQADQERRHNEKFVLCANPSVSLSRPGDRLDDEDEPPLAAAEYEDGSDDDIDLDEENARIGATVCHKRKFLCTDDDDDDDDDDDIPTHANVSAGKEGLDRNICALADIGQHYLKYSGET